MKIHNLITLERSDLVPAIEANATKVGLNKIDFDKYYTLVKLGAKNSSPRGYPDKYTVTKGLVWLIGNENFVAIYVSGITDWFRTSSVLSCKKVKAGYKIETNNSYYLLEE